MFLWNLTHRITLYLITAVTLLVAAVILTQICRKVAARRRHHWQLHTFQTMKSNMDGCASSDSVQQMATITAAGCKGTSKEGVRTRGQASIATPAHITAVEKPVFGIITAAALAGEAAGDGCSCHVPRGKNVVTMTSRAAASDDSNDV